MSLKVLKDALAEVKRDEFAVGDVLRWTANDKYTYAALKTPVGWYTTAGSTNSFVPKMVDFDGLIEVLAAGNVTNVEFAAKWLAIEDADAEIARDKWINVTPPLDEGSEGY